ncbi:MAG: DNA-directed RNA polymerase subunit H [Nanoarchaeota archaeon]
MILNIMHVLQPKHSKISKKEEEILLTELNISKTQLPKIKDNDSALPDGSVIGDIIKIERKDRETDQVFVYYRVVV